MYVLITYHRFGDDYVDGDDGGNNDDDVGVDDNDDDEDLLTLSFCFIDCGGREPIFDLNKFR